MTYKLFLAIAVLILSALAFGCTSGFAGHPKDSELINNFQAQKADFEKLLQMFLSDKDLVRVAYDFTRPADIQSIGVNEQRINEYRELFRKLNLSAGIEGYGDKEIVTFYVSTQGLSVTGSSKGYAYTKNYPQLVVDDLDTYQPAGGKSFTAYKHIEGNWYLYLDYEN